MNCLNCQSCLCSSPLLMRVEIFSQLADVHGCCLTPNSSICMRCQWDWWLTQQRGIGRRGGGGTVWKCVCLCVCMGWQSKEARRWLRDFEAQPSLVASLPVCVADNMLTPRHLIGYPGWSRLGLVTLCPDPDKVLSCMLTFWTNLGANCVAINTGIYDVCYRLHMLI